jgi:hypothetical protein
VIRLWYAIGTSVIPGLLIPVVTSYFERWKAPPDYVFGAMVLGWVTATLWLIIGQTGGSGYPLGIEPMYPGLFVSVVVWGGGILRMENEALR